MKRFIFSMATILIVVTFWFGCKKEGRIDHINYKGPAPEPISNVKVTPTPGGAILVYEVPEDPNFYYAEAEYEIQPGVYRQAKASYYTDTLKLVGFGDTLSHDVKIYSVSENEKKSESMTITVNPLAPPVQTVFKTITLESTFGGVQIGFENKSKAKLAIEVLVDSSGLGTWATAQTFYTGAKEGTFTIRGYDTIERKFGVYIRDRWDNKSDTLLKKLTPLFEEEIPKNTWSALKLPTDTWQQAEGYVIEHLFDNNIEFAGIFASTNASVLPQWFTLDLGEKVVMSRVTMHHAPAGRSHFYDGSAFKVVEIWGSNNPNPDGSWESWDSLGTFHSFKPSGLPYGQWNDEDSQYGWIQGENFEFDHKLPPYRYIRVKTDETYGSSGQVVISELDVWGKIVP